MKKTHLPDFTQLCRPEQNHIGFLLSQQIFFFFLSSIVGFFWEVFFMYLLNGHFAKRGFFYGPWLPIYGVGAVLFYCLLRKKKHPVRVFFLSMIIGTSLELLIGWLLDTIWQLRYWNYSSCLLNYNGYICLWSGIGFGIAGILWICLFSPIVSQLWLHLPHRFRSNLNTLLILLFLLDCAAALILPNAGYSITFP